MQKEERIGTSHRRTKAKKAASTPFGGGGKKRGQYESLE